MAEENDFLADPRIRGSVDLPRSGDVESDKDDDEELGENVTPAEDRFGVLMDFYLPDRTGRDAPMAIRHLDDVETTHTRDQLLAKHAPANKAIEDTKEPQRFEDTLDLMKSFMTWAGLWDDLGNLSEREQRFLGLEPDEDSLIPPSHQDDTISLPPDALDREVNARRARLHKKLEEYILNVGSELRWRVLNEHAEEVREEEDSLRNQVSMVREAKNITEDSERAHELLNEQQIQTTARLRVLKRHAPELFWPEQLELKDTLRGVKDLVEQTMGEPLITTEEGEFQFQFDKYKKALASIGLDDFEAEKREQMEELSRTYDEIFRKDEEYLDELSDQQLQILMGEPDPHRVEDLRRRLRSASIILDEVYEGHVPEAIKNTATALKYVALGLTGGTLARIGASMFLTRFVGPGSKAARLIPWMKNGRIIRNVGREAAFDIGFNASWATADLLKRNMNDEYVSYWQFFQDFGRYMEGDLYFAAAVFGPPTVAKGVNMLTDWWRMRYTDESFEEIVREVQRFKKLKNRGKKQEAFQDILRAVNDGEVLERPQIIRNTRDFYDDLFQVTNEEGKPVGTVANISENERERLLRDLLFMYFGKRKSAEIVKHDLSGLTHDVPGMVTADPAEGASDVLSNLHTRGFKRFGEGAFEPLTNSEILEFQTYMLFLEEAGQTKQLVKAWRSSMNEASAVLEEADHVRRQEISKRFEANNVPKLPDGEVTWNLGRALEENGYQIRFTHKTDPRRVKKRVRQFEPDEEQAEDVIRRLEKQEGFSEKEAQKAREARGKAKPPDEVWKPGTFEFELTDPKSGENVGYMVGYRHRDYDQIQAVYIREEDRGKGLGLALYRRAIDHSLSNGRAVWSDDRVSKEASKVYEALSRRGYNVEMNWGTQFDEAQGSWFIPPDHENPMVLEIIRKRNRGDFEQMSRDLGIELHIHEKMNAQRIRELQGALGFRFEHTIPEDLTRKKAERLLSALPDRISESMRKVGLDEDYLMANRGQDFELIDAVNSPTVISHEFGHRVIDRIRRESLRNPNIPNEELVSIAKESLDELNAYLGRHGLATDVEGIDLNPEELFADWIGMLLRNPNRAREIAPETYKKYGPDIIDQFKQWSGVEDLPEKFVFRVTDGPQKERALNYTSYRKKEWENFEKISNMEQSPSWINELEKMSEGKPSDGLVRMFGPAYAATARIQKRTGVPVYEQWRRVRDTYIEMNRKILEGDELFRYGHEKLNNLFKQWDMFGGDELARERKKAVTRFLYDWDESLVKEKFTIPDDVTDVSKLPKKVWRSYELDKKQRRAVKTIRDFFDEAKEKFGIESSLVRYFRRDPNIPLHEVFRRMRKGDPIPSMQNPARMARGEKIPFGETPFDEMKWYEKDLQTILKNYVNFFRRERFADELNRFEEQILGIEQMIRTTGKGSVTETPMRGISEIEGLNGKDINYVKGYLKEMRGFVSASDVEAQKVKFGLVRQARRFLSTEDAVKFEAWLDNQRAGDMISIGQYTIPMGYSLSKAIKNKSQEANNIATFGIDGWFNAQKYINENMHIADEVITKLNIRDSFVEYGEAFSEIQRREFGESSLRYMGREAMEIAKDPKKFFNSSRAMIAFGQADFSNVRKGGISAGLLFEKHLPALKKGDITFAEFTRRARIDWMPNVILDDIAQKIRSGKIFAASKDGAPKSLRSLAKGNLQDLDLRQDSAQGQAMLIGSLFTQFDYTKGGMMRALWKKGGPMPKNFMKYFGTYQSWRLSYLYFLTRHARNLPEGATTLAMLIAAQKSLQVIASQTLNVNTDTWTKLGPISSTGGLVRSPLHDGIVAGINISWALARDTGRWRPPEKKVPYPFSAEGHARKGARELARILIGSTNPVGRIDPVTQDAQRMIAAQNWGQSFDSFVDMIERSVDVDFRNIGTNEEAREAVTRKLENEIADLLFGRTKGAVVSGEAGVGGGAGGAGVGAGVE